MQLLFTTNNLPFSIVIRGITSCKWSHCAVAFGDTVYESRFGGVVKTKLSEFKKRGEYLSVDIPLPDEQAAEEFAIAQLGKGYDYLGIIGFWFNRDFHKDDKWYCSEYAAEIIRAGGLELGLDILNGVSPRDLYVLALYLRQ